MDSHPHIIGRKYQLMSMIGSGSFGDVYRGMNLKNGKAVAVKLENRRRNTAKSQLLYESKLLRVFQLQKGGISNRVPRARWYGEQGIYNALVMDLLGPSLEDLFSLCSRRFSLKTSLMLADQMIECIEYLHANNILHRDIKPHNFLMGVGAKSDRLYLIDFGLSKRFIDPRTNRHIPCRNDKRLTGTARYSSINSHLGIEQSRRDDLESIGYILMYFIRGELPWQGLGVTSKRKKLEGIKEVKLSFPVEDLCAGLPELAEYLRYCRDLGFDAVPDYMYLKRIVRELFRTMNYQYDFLFDWKLRPEKKQASIESLLAPKSSFRKSLEDMYKIHPKKLIAVRK